MADWMAEQLDDTTVAVMAAPLVAPKAVEMADLMVAQLGYQMEIRKGKWTAELLVALMVVLLVVLMVDQMVERTVVKSVVLWVVLRVEHLAD